LEEASDMRKGSEELIIKEKANNFSSYAFLFHKVQRGQINQMHEEIQIYLRLKFNIKINSPILKSDSIINIEKEVKHWMELKIEIGKGDRNNYHYKKISKKNEIKILPKIGKSIII
jgi:hypothetical protein